MLLPAPVGCLSAGAHQSPLCDRAAAIDDVKTRFGETVATADLLPRPVRRRPDRRHPTVHPLRCVSR